MAGAKRKPEGEAVEPGPSDATPVKMPMPSDAPGGALPKGGVGFALPRAPAAAGGGPAAADREAAAKRRRRNLLLGDDDAGGGGAGGGGPRPPEGGYVIPRQEDTCQAGVGRTDRKFNPDRYVPEEEREVKQEDRFEAAAPEVKVEVTYGLQSRGARPAAAGGIAGKRKREPAAVRAVPHVDEAQQYREDLARLPEQASLDAYEAMPVAEFGAAMLRGMGWKEGEGIGRNKEEVKAVEYVKRPTRLGLGAKPNEDAFDLPKKKGKRWIPKPGEERGPKKDLVYYGKDGVQKHVKTLDEELVERVAEGVQVGKVMHVVAGQHEGLRAEVLALNPPAEGRSDRAVVKLLPSNATVSLRCKDLGDAPPAPRDGGRGRARAPKRERRPELAREAAWLLADIQVKIVDKRRLGGGKYYQQKAVVVDVVSKYAADLQLADGKLLQGVDQKHLETYVPDDRGRRMMVVAGDRRGQLGTLMARNRERGNAAVQLEDDLQVVAFSLDDICSYAGGIGGAG